MDKFHLWITSTKTVVLIFVVGTVLLFLTNQSSGEHLSSFDSSERAAAHLFNKKTRKLFLKLFRRKIKIPSGSSLSLATQVSRPNIFPGLFNQEDGFITDAVLELPMWLDLDVFAEAMYSSRKNTNGTVQSKSGKFAGMERCFLYEKLEWLFGMVTQLSREVSHGCLLKFICETQAIHSFYPDYPNSIAFELIHLILTPSFGLEDPCFEEYVMAENTGRVYATCETYDFNCPFSVGGILIRNFFPEPKPPPTQSPYENSYYSYY